MTNPKHPIPVIANHSPDYNAVSFSSCDGIGRPYIVYVKAEDGGPVTSDILQSAGVTLFDAGDLVQRREEGDFDERKQIDKRADEQAFWDRFPDMHPDDPEQSS